MQIHEPVFNNIGARTYYSVSYRFIDYSFPDVGVGRTHIATGCTKRNIARVRNCRCKDDAHTSFQIFPMEEGYTKESKPVYSASLLDAFEISTRAHNTSPAPVGTPVLVEHMRRWNPPAMVRSKMGAMKSVSHKPKEAFVLRGLFGIWIPSRTCTP